MILALKTDGPITRMWLFNDETSTRSHAELSWESGRDLADRLLGELDNFLVKHSSSMADINAILIFSGPGSFTSLRIGHTVANALATSLKVPIVGALGDDWVQVGLKQLKSATSGIAALPYYGAEAHITPPKA